MDLRRSILPGLSFFLILFSPLIYAVSDEIDIFFEQSLYFAQDDVIPLTQVTVGKMKTNVIVDTAGSGYPFLVESFARKIKIIKPSEKIAQPKFWNRPIKIQFENLRALADRVGIAKMPDTWCEKHGIGILFNPVFYINDNSNSKRPPQVLVLDFMGKKMFGLNGPSVDAMYTYLDHQYKDKKKIKADLLSSSASRLIVEANLPGREGAPTMLDTGASSSSFDQSYLEGLESVTKKRISNFAGQSFFIGKTAPQTVLLNGIELGQVPLGIKTIDTSAKPINSTQRFIEYRGIIGMDLLKHCALAIAYPKTIHLYCQP